MSEDNLYLLGCYLLLGLTLLLGVARSKHKLKTAAIHLLLAGLYSAVLGYNLVFNASGGSGLVWLVFLMAAIAIHWLVSAVALLLTFTKK